MKKVVGIIPARYSSTRLPAKPLIIINGKPMIQHVYERSKKSSLLSDVYIATDDNRIVECVKKFNGKVILTSPDHKSGTDRVAEVAKKISADIIVNIQGDEPLIVPEMIDQAIYPLLKKNKENIYMSTLVKRIIDPQDLFNPSIAKVVIDSRDYAIYFSRAPIPYMRDFGENILANFNKLDLNNYIFYKHIGLYVYSKQFLLKLVKLKPTYLEQIEKLEQLRVLQNGFKIKVVETEYNTLGVDTKHELQKVKKIMSSQL